MANINQTTGGLYRNRINVIDDDELRDWAKRLVVPAEKLKDAIAKVGNWSDDVQHELSESCFSLTHSRCTAPCGRNTPIGSGL